MKRLHPVAMQHHTALAAGLLCLPPLGLGTAISIEPIRFMLPQDAIWFACLAIGVAATISHSAMTYAFSLAPPSTVAPLNYLKIVTSVLFGFVFFGDFRQA